jgi:8-oxo-dGTP pyrophosphatase MutT (NUDIX family)
MDNKKINELKKQFSNSVDINGREDFLNSSILIPLVFIDGEYHFIFQKRNKNIRQGGEVCFPGGRIDKSDKNSLETALRETYEEFNIRKEKIQIIGRLNSVFSPVGVMVDGYAGIMDIRNLEDIKFNISEVEYIFSVPVSFFEKNNPAKHYVQIKAHPSVIDKNGNEINLLPVEQFNLPKVYSKPWGNSKYAIYLYKYNNEVIWGLTARFIIDFINRLKIS